jgi:hypothetical protein
MVAAGVALSAALGACGSLLPQWKLIRESTQSVVIEYDPGKLDEEGALTAGKGYCAAYGKDAVFSTSMLNPTTGRRISSYICAFRGELRKGEAAIGTGDAVPDAPANPAAPPR